MWRTRFVTAVVMGFVGSAWLASAGCRGSVQSSEVTATPTAASPLAQKSPETPPATPSAPQSARTPLVAPVDFEQLVALMPELPGWTRTKPRGLQSSAGIAVSEATAEYTNGDSTIKLEIMDSGFSDLVLAPLSTMLGPTFSERTATGYRQYAAVGGSPGFESWQSDVNEGAVTVVVGKRFVITARGLNVAALEPVRSLVRAVDVARLAALR